MSKQRDQVPRKPRVLQWDVLHFSYISLFNIRVPFDIRKSSLSVYLCRPSRADVFSFAFVTQGSLPSLFELRKITLG